MVKVGFIEDKPIVIAAVAAKISQTPFEKGSIEQLYEESRENEEKSKKLVEIMEREHLVFIKMPLI
jgi:hypothetical protein